jgi:hypothetical protein
MASSGMLRRVALVRTDVSEELDISSQCARLIVIASVVPSSPIFVALIKEGLSSSETSVLTKPHGVASQKTPFFIVTAVNSSNLVQRYLVQKSSPV